MSGLHYLDIASLSAPPGMSLSVAPSPLTTPFPAVDTISLASTTLPGKWTLLDAKKVFGWQIQQGYALSGAVVFPIGDKLVVPKFRGEFWNAADLVAFKAIRALLFKKPAISAGLIVGAMGIDHPELAALGVTDVVIGEVGPLIQEEGGLWVIQVDFLQYRAPQKAPPKPTFIVPDTSTDSAALTNAQAETAKLTAEAAAKTAILFP